MFSKIKHNLKLEGNIVFELNKVETGIREKRKMTLTLSVYVQNGDAKFSLSCRENLQYYGANV